MKNKQKKKIMWLDIWDIQEQEAWFTAMAFNGWQLVKIGNFTATFEQCPPQKIIYRCDIFKKAYTYENEQIDLYRQSGWEYVASREFLHFFKQKSEQETSEIHTDPIEQAETVALLKKDIMKRGIISLAIAVLMLGLAYWMLQIDSVGNFLNNDFIAPSITILFTIFIIFTMLRGMIHITRLTHQLQTGSPLKHNHRYHKKMKQNNFFGMSIIVILSIWVLFNFVEVFTSITDERFPPIPDNELPIVQIADIIDHTKFKRVADKDDFPGSIDNYYREESSILVPKQYELNEMVEVADSDTYHKPSIRSFGYHVRNKWMAKQLLDALKEENAYDQDYYQPIQTKFDESWLLVEDTEIDLIARRANKVYRVNYYGEEPAEKIIEASEIKAGY